MSRFTRARASQLEIPPTAVRFCFLATLLAASVSAQTAEPPPAFEAASVKLNTGAAPYQNMGASQIEMRNFPLEMLIDMAYGVSDYALSGPDWLMSVNVDIVAKLPASAASLSPQDRGRLTTVMLQGLLEERFHLKVHRVEKLIPGYALVVAPGGPKMRRVEKPVGGGSVSQGNIVAKSVPIAQIVASVGGTLGRPVRDMTGLSGYYEFNLKWTPEAARLAGAENTSTAPDDRPPSIFTALQEQLGLRLEPREFPIQTVVVDHVEKVPVEN